MPELFGMSIGSWILLLVIIVWAVIAIKVYFFGGFKKKKPGQKASIGACCDTGDEDCAACDGCNEPATKRNAVAPVVKSVPKEAAK